MSRSAGRPRGAPDLKERILAASRTILVTEGYEALTMRRLAREIGYSATALYLYFENREAIVAELGRAGLAVLEACVTPHQPASDPRERLRDFARQYFRFSSEHLESYRIIFMQDSTLADAMFRSAPGKDAGGAGQRVFALLVHAFEHLRDTDSGWKGVHPQRAAEVFWTSLHGVIALKITCGKFLLTPGDELVELAAASLLAGLTAEGEAGKSEKKAGADLPRPPKE